MTKNTHSTGGFFLALLPLYLLINFWKAIFSLPYLILLLGVYFYFANVGSALPDIDLKSSYISKRYPLLWRLCGKKYKHRSFTHSILALIFLGIFLCAFITLSENNEIVVGASLGLFVGYLSHLVLDLFNPQGIELFYPCRYNVKLLKIKTNTAGEKIFNNLLKLLTLLFLINFLFKYSRILI